MNNTKIVKLARPIEHEGATIAELTFREMLTLDAMAMDLVKGETAKNVALLASMSGKTIPFMQKIPWRELNRIADEVAPLLGESDTATVAGSTASS